MSRVYNFSAGPAALPEAVLLKVQQSLLDWQGRGVSVMELSHRSDDFLAIASEAEENLRQLMSIPDNYKILFLQGGATGQFAAVPNNLLGKTGIADYVEAGHWSKKSIIEAQRYGDIRIIASNGASGRIAYPDPKKWRLSDQADYVHYVSNETVDGLQLHQLPDTGDIPCIVDISSCILSEPIDVNHFGLLYAGAQKNLGPAGMVVVIVRQDLLDQSLGGCPTLNHYKSQAKAGSMLNTPPTFAWYLAGMVFKWVKEQGGVKVMAEINRRKAAKLYAAIDQSALCTCHVKPESRSIMNVVFKLPDEAMTARFLKEAEKCSLTALKGHKAVGGVRASIYNAVPEAAVDALIAFISDFDQNYAGGPAI